MQDSTLVTMLGTLLLLCASGGISSLNVPDKVIKLQMPSVKPTKKQIAFKVQDSAALNGFSLKRGGDQEAVKLAKPKKRHLKVKMNHTFAEHEIEVWYINQDRREDRRKC